MQLFQTFPVFLMLTSAVVQGQVPASSPDPVRPNILFLLADDQRNDALGCAGHPYLQTPVIDQLAANGVRFSNVFVTTSICAASRASILTGLHERTHGFTFGTPPIPRVFTESSYATLLRENGYHTGFIGKFGVLVENGEPSRMFDVFTEIGRNPYFRKMEDGTLRHETDLAGDEAIQFLKDRPRDKPFCLSVSFNAPHAEDSDRRPGIGHFPWPPSVDGLYEDVTLPPPRLSDPAIFEAHPEFLKDSLNRTRYFWRWDTPEKYQTNMRAYLRMISGIDAAIGRMREALEALDLADNTIIIYMADNGFYMGDRGFAGKWSHYEESLRVPLIVYDPRQAESLRGRVLEEMTLNIDVPASLLALAGIDIPDHYEGSSLLALLSGKTVSSWRDGFFCEHLMDRFDIPKWEGLRGERFVYARYFEQDPVYEFLHDLKTDPDQLHNLAPHPDFQEVMSMMRDRTSVARDRCLATRARLLE